MTWVIGPKGVYTLKTALQLKTELVAKSDILEGVVLGNSTNFGWFLFPTIGRFTQFEDWLIENNILYTKDGSTFIIRFNQFSEPESLPEHLLPE